MSQVVGRLLVEGDAPPALERELAVVGHSINRRDALEKVTGKAMYSSDMVLPGMLHAKILRCPHAHAHPDLVTVEIVTCRGICWVWILLIVRVLFNSVAGADFE